ncbi:hypothetical protein HMPREF9238_01229 [Gleimia europaea ACS-120-V-Col10b]|uniref:Uncharacterized protein n=1 Tax=Gleimia europaea ACS-120-V-Col10b TaxID=883069 RepID=A0A9W5RFN2_9ACTO|nr:hypothetical protein HMPREF9238_01229 [Gleimia europaea ACS-120-V-Col10b]
MRGEHPIRKMSAGLDRGSSPHARGALARWWRRFRFLGVIPACAGSTPSARTRTPTGRGHPRMRGEHVFSRCFFPCDPGSSPHARGALFLFTRWQRIRGVIPACAGSTAGGSKERQGRSGHPRMRGEHDSDKSLVCGSKGSSPHARGAPLIGVAAERGTGVIPACAGSTS